MSNYKFWMTGYLVERKFRKGTKTKVIFCLTLCLNGKKHFDRDPGSSREKGMGVYLAP